jgi:hypothetical protein
MFQVGGPTSNFGQRAWSCGGGGRTGGRGVAGGCAVRLPDRQPARPGGGAPAAGSAIVVSVHREGKDVEKAYDLAQDAAVVLAGKPANVADLKAGTWIVLRLSKDKKTVVGIKGMQCGREQPGRLAGIGTNHLATGAGRHRPRPRFFVPRPPSVARDNRPFSLRLACIRTSEVCRQTDARRQSP